MIAHIYDMDRDHYVAKYTATPECGQDFSDESGDCLSCYDGIWVVYIGPDTYYETIEEFLADHPEAEEQKEEA